MTLTCFWECPTLPSLYHNSAKLASGRATKTWRSLSHSRTTFWAVKSAALLPPASKESPCGALCNRQCPPPSSFSRQLPIKLRCLISFPGDLSNPLSLQIAHGYRLWQKQISYQCTGDNLAFLTKKKRAWVKNKSSTHWAEVPLLKDCDQIVLS